jgi:hypothetical protein
MIPESIGLALSDKFVWLGSFLSKVQPFVHDSHYINPHEAGTEVFLCEFLLRPFRTKVACLQSARHTLKLGYWIGSRIRMGGIALTQSEIILACIVGVPLIFALGRFSSRVTWFHAKQEEKYSVREFMRGRE